ncbi:glycoside hydrolase family 3 protein [Aplosporella prunicola CBS 121167]|uniref:Probable beta-glucosidase G n=1 Tax=Aplosporella prunicola CBS 121167 TaxID=1176127 RepID=A0A6A6BW98_9PEZI|nr:glycoside hydrolase family 3 protein [Aplosporella prunicola CBS 121167]KAF2146981.1 glycoside hydrolase family 3 protein [Aplosporella prunicola CBS 121167]
MAPLRDLFVAAAVAAVGNAAQDWDHSLFTNSPPVYPSPNMTGVEASGLSGWEAAMQKAEAFTNNLTLEEKAVMLTGAPGPCVGNIAPIPRVGFKGLCLQDGPLAVRQADYASAFPAGLSAAASWDRDLIHLRGKYIAEEFKGKGSQVFLGPVAGPLGRSGYNGRNWEGFSPDPYLTGVAMEESILGVQSVGVQANAKHWIAYEQETQRNPEEAFDPNAVPYDEQIMSVSSNLDDRTMHELYVWPFANAVRAGVASVMCSYNRINGSYACQNSKTQNGILKGELGFQGYIMSDWMGTHSGVASIEAGLDMNMPGGISFKPTLPGVPTYFGANLTEAVNNGTVPEWRVNDMVRRVMTPYFLLGQDKDFPLVDPSMGEYPSVNEFDKQDGWYDDWNKAKALGEPDVDVRANHSKLIRELGAAGIVLLKNENNTLPLKAPKRIGVFGNAAGDLTTGLYYHDKNYEYGCLPVGGGSGSARLNYVVSPLEAIKEQAKKDGTNVQYILNNTQLTTSGGFLKQIYPQPDVCLVFVKTWASEGEDRTTLHLDWDGDDVVTEVARNCSNTVVITNSGGLNVLPWADNENVTAILAAHLPGNEIGNSILDVLYGNVNPSGKLPYTIAHEVSDYDFANVTREVADPKDTNAWQADFEERLLIDYRYFDYHNLSVAFPFGHGLSYTSFELADLAITPVSNASAAGLPKAVAKAAPGGNPALWDTLYTATATVTNSGDLPGAAVPQLYVRLPAAAGEGTPLRQLRGFEKVPLEKGEQKQVRFELMRRDLSVWDVVAQEWRVPEGEFVVSVGFSSRDFRDEKTFTI